MTGKDARGGAQGSGRWKTLLSLMLGAAALVVVTLAARLLMGPSAAQAQRPGATAPAAPTSPPPRGRVNTAANTGRTGSLPAPSNQAGAVPAAAKAPVGPLAGSSGDQQLATLAVVNGQQIGRQQLAQESLKRYGSDVLETIINRYVIAQACQKRNIQITEQDVDEEVKQLAGKFGLSVDRWLEMLMAERDLSPDQYRREIVWPTLALRRLAQDKLEVSPADRKQAWEAEYGPKVKARLIVASTQEKANRLYAQAVANPDDFGQLAKDESEDATSASVRGMIPPIRMHSGSPDVLNVAFRLREGEISPVIKVANQYFILKCEQRIPETIIAENFRASAEAQLEERIRDQKLRDTATDLFRHLQDEAQVVNVYNSPQLRQQMPGVAATINGQQILMHQLAEECIRRHGKEVLDGEINRLLLTQELQRRGKTIQRPDIDAEIARAADAYGYVRQDGTPDVNAWLGQVQKEEGSSVELYINDAVWPTVALKKLVEENADIQVSEEDLQKGFDSNYGERVEILAIVLNNQRQAAKVWELARNNPTDQFFGELAQQYSIEPVSRANFGKVPPIRRHSGQPNLEDEAFTLEPGQLSGIIAVGDKYIILRCQGRTQPVVEEFAAVKDELYKDILEKKMRLAMSNEFDRLKESAQIDNFLTGQSQSGKRAVTAGPPVGPVPPAAASTGQRPAAVSTGQRPASGPSR